MKEPALLTGTIRHYDWGGVDFIPELLAINNDEKRPHAEYWLGVHPSADCRLQFSDGQTFPLREFLSDDPSGKLGPAVVQQFGKMPYLLKALDVRDMLSIQVHPSKEAAISDFAAENAKGTPLDSPQRNYKDDNHKPELMYAMGDFWLLHGFRSPELMREILQSVPELNFLLPLFEQESYAGIYRHVMEMEQVMVNETLKPLLHRILPLYHAGQLDKSYPDYWAARAHETFSAPGRTDRGIFSIYLFNLVGLKAGDAIYQAAGVPHAYVEGRNIEIMADSDNVLRGGLTTKHVNVEELLRHVRCEPTIPHILRGEQRGHVLAFPTPAPDFELGLIDLKAGESASFTPATAEILLLTDGEVTVSGSATAIKLRRGQPSGIVFPGLEITITAASAAKVFKATVPAVNK